MDMFFDCLSDAALDTLRLVPFLLVTYFVLVAFEYKAGAQTRSVVARAGAAGPAIGALLGAVPQCGFSAAAATLYAGRVLTLGTLFAVFLSTSDEMLPLMIAQQSDPALMVKLVLFKVALGMVTGFLVDLAIRVLGLKVQGMGAEFAPAEPQVFELESGSVLVIDPEGASTLDGRAFDLDALLAQADDEEGLSLEEIEAGARAQFAALEAGEVTTAGVAAASGAGLAGGADEVNATGMVGDSGEPGATGAAPAATSPGAVSQALSGDSDSAAPSAAPETLLVGNCGPGCACGADMGWGGVVRETIVRSLEVTVFVFLVTLVLNLILGYAGEDVLAEAISSERGVSVLLSALVGLIPNCAASVAITQLYLAGVLDLGATMAGLLVSAGIGLLVLFSANRSTKQNLAILGVLYLIGIVWGFAIQLSGLTF